MVIGDAKAASPNLELLNPNPKSLNEGAMETAGLANGEAVASQLDETVKAVSRESQNISPVNGISDEMLAEVVTTEHDNVAKKLNEPMGSGEKGTIKTEPVLNGETKLLCDPCGSDKNGVGNTAADSSSDTTIKNENGDVFAEGLAVTNGEEGEKSIDSVGTELTVSDESKECSETENASGSCNLVAPSEDRENVAEIIKEEDTRNEADVTMVNNSEASLDRDKELNEVSLPEVIKGEPLGSVGQVTGVDYSAMDEDEILESDESKRKDDESESLDAGEAKDDEDEEELLGDGAVTDEVTEEANEENVGDDAMDVDETAIEEMEADRDSDDPEPSEADRTGIFHGATMATLEHVRMNVVETPERNEGVGSNEAAVGVGVAVAEGVTHQDDAEVEITHVASKEGEKAPEVEQSQPSLKLISLALLQGGELQVKTEPTEKNSVVGVSNSSMTMDGTKIKTEVSDVGVGPSEGDFLRTIKNETEVGSEKEVEKRSADQMEGDSDSSCPKKPRLEEEANKDAAKRREEVRRAIVDSEDEDADDPEPLPDEPGEEFAGVTATAEGEDGAEAETPRPLRGSDDESADADDPSTSTSPCPSPSPCFSPTLSGGLVLGTTALSTDAVAVIPAMRSLRRGALAHLSRSDLEELIVQKLCEAITERSPQAGELRRRVEALEEEVDKWKERAMMCAKQCRELDLVLQKYLGESQRQIKAQGAHMVTPIRVTRSVGLQVAIGMGTKPKALPPTKPPAKASTGSTTSAAAATKQKAAMKPPASPAVTPRQSPASPKTQGPVIRPKPASKIMAVRPATAAQPTAAAVNKTKTSRTVAPVRTPPVSADSGVIDLTDDERPASASRPSPGKKVVPAGTQKGGTTKYLIATSPGVPSPPQLVFKGNYPQRNQTTAIVRQHPAPLPATPSSQPYHPSWKNRPPRPALKISNTSSGIVLSWDMELKSDHESISSYQLYAYQEGTQPPSPSLWREVGDVKALPLPMACTLSCFVPGHRYHFSVRAVDVHMRVGPFSYPGSILLNK